MRTETRRIVRFFGPCGVPGCGMETPHAHQYENTPLCVVCGRRLWSDGSCAKQAAHLRQAQGVLDETP